jgi:hypothetical protein
MIVPMGYRPSLCRRYRLVGGGLRPKRDKDLVIAKDMLDETTKDSKAVNRSP